MKKAIDSVNTERDAVDIHAEEDYAGTLEDFYQISQERFEQLMARGKEMDVGIAKMTTFYGEEGTDKSVESMMKSLAAFLKLLQAPVCGVTTRR